MVASGFMVAHQVAGKAVRDGLFLSRFSPSDLPKIVLASAIASILLGLSFTRILARRGPLRLVPLTFSGGSLIHLAEFALLRGADNAVRAKKLRSLSVRFFGSSVTI